MRGVAVVLATLRQRWRASLWWTIGLVAMTGIQLYVYPSIEKTSAAMDQFVAAFPPELIAIFRISDYTSPEGFLGTELFSMTAPLVIIAIAASGAAAATTDDEERGTADLQYTMPIPRVLLMLARLLAVGVILAIAGAALVLTIAVGAPLVDLPIEVSAVIAITLSCVMVGVFFGALAALVGAATGRKALALGATIGVALLSFVIYSLAPLVDTFDAIIDAVPFQWAFGNDPLVNGIDLPGIAALATGSVIMIGVGLAVLHRRDIRL